MRPGPLYSTKIIRAVMAEHQTVFKKKYGQNFLCDGNIVRRIVDLAQVTSDDTVIEIGPGIGTLTQELLERAGHVHVIEVDAQLIPILEAHFGDRPNFSFTLADALKIDWEELHAKFGNVKIVANLPYYITTPLLLHLLPLPWVQSFTLMMQKEVADRIHAKPGTKDYGALSIFCACYTQVEGQLRAPRSVFYPSPKVDSTVLHFVRRSAPEGVNITRFTDRVLGCFQRRRKTLFNALSHQTSLGKEELKRLLEDLELPDSIRVEALDLEQLLRLERALEEREQEIQ